MYFFVFFDSKFSISKLIHNNSNFIKRYLKIYKGLINIYKGSKPNLIKDSLNIEEYRDLHVFSDEYIFWVRKFKLLVSSFSFMPESGSLGY